MSTDYGVIVDLGNDLMSAAARGTVLHMWGNDVTAWDKIYASSIAGGVGGCAGGFLRMSLYLIFTFVISNTSIQVGAGTFYLGQ